MARLRALRRQGLARDRGETLVEVVITVVIVGISVTALVSALATISNAGAGSRNAVLADTVMRNYAEATRAATASCTPGGSYTVSFTPPTGYSVSTSPAGGTCPAATATQQLTLTVRLPNGGTQTMDIKVRTP